MRNIKQAGPYLWAEKAALRKIRGACGNVGDGASTLATYLALTEIASDKQSDRFESTQGYIAGKACLGLRTVHRKLQLLVELELIAMTVPSLRAPAMYELLPLRHDGRTLRHDNVALRHRRKQASWHSLEESPEESPEKSPEEAQDPDKPEKPPSSVPSDQTEPTPRISLRQMTAEKMYE